MIGDVDVRCPTCLSLDWFSDGDRITDTPDRRAPGGRAADRDPVVDREAWFCVFCGFHAVPHSSLANALDARRDAADDRSAVSPRRKLRRQLPPQRVPASVVRRLL